MAYIVIDVSLATSFTAAMIALQGMILGTPPAEIFVGALIGMFLVFIAHYILEDL